MEETAAWGGQIELQALAQALERHILVHCVGLPVLELGTEYKGSLLCSNPGPRNFAMLAIARLTCYARVQRQSRSKSLVCLSRQDDVSQQPALLFGLKAVNCALAWAHCSSCDALLLCVWSAALTETGCMLSCREAKPAPSVLPAPCLCTGGALQQCHAPRSLTVEENAAQLAAKCVAGGDILFQ